MCMELATPIIDSTGQKKSGLAKYASPLLSLNDLFYSAITSNSILSFTLGWNTISAL